MLRALRQDHPSQASNVTHRLLAAIACLPLLLAVTSCDKGNPVASPGTTLTVSVNPSTIAANGNAVVTVTAVRGSVAVRDIEIQLATTLGKIDPAIVTTDSRGIARSLLEGTGISGPAKVTASSGGATPATADVTIGIKVERITLTVSPSTIAEDADATVTLRAVVTDAQGGPVNGALVAFSTEIGRLASNGSLRETRNGGEATDTLRLTSGELSTITDGKISVRAETGGSVSGTANATSTITIRQKPRASFEFQRTGLTVVFTDTSTGNPRQWQWDFGDGNTSTQQNPAHEYTAEDSYVVTLTVTNDLGSSTASRVVTVTAG